MSVRTQNHHKCLSQNNLSLPSLVHLSMVNGEHQSHISQLPSDKENNHFTPLPYPKIVPWQYLQRLGALAE